MGNVNVCDKGDAALRFVHFQLERYRLEKNEFKRMNNNNNIHYKIYK